MSDQQQRVVDWLDDVLAWLREPLTEMPVERVMLRLRAAFDINVVSWTDQRGLLMTQMLYDPPHVMDAHADTLAEFMAGMHRDCHPLTVWYDTTASVAPQTSGRVPDGLVPRKKRAILVKPLIRLGLNQQMTLYHRREGATASFFVVARGSRDFDDDDLALGSYVQRSLVTLDRQARALKCHVESPRTHRGVDMGLTGRQLAVLQLLSDGLSARQSARRLACSPRTVEKHLQNAYRKLAVNDRVNAIRAARLAGAVIEHQTPGTPSN